MQKNYLVKKMTIHIIASGESGSKWNGEGPSIGVNDSWKWGHPTDYLLLLNFPNQFQSSRLDTILQSKPKKVYSNVPSSWTRHFDNVVDLKLRRWSSTSKLSKNYIFHSNTSPFVGISLAYSWGFNHIVLWGVDMITHHRYGKGQSGFFQEFDKYRTFINALKNQGVQVHLGATGTALDHILPVWNKEKLTV